MEIKIRMSEKDAERFHDILECQMDTLDAELEGLDRDSPKWKKVVGEIAEDQRVCRIAMDVLEEVM